jgi:hypothetical protein
MTLKLTNDNRQKSAEDLTPHDREVSREETSEIAADGDRVGTDVGDEGRINLGQAGKKYQSPCACVPVVVQNGRKKVPQVLRKRSLASLSFDARNKDDRLRTQ